MKKLAFVVMGVLLFSIAQAQVITQVGFKAGGLTTWILNSNIIAGKTDTTYRFSGGYTAGLNVGLYFNNRTYYSHKMKGLQLEVNYTSHRQGYKSKSENPLNYKYAWNLSYLDIGLFFQVMPSSDNGTYILVGPQFSILMAGKNKGFFETLGGPRIDFDTDWRKKFSTGNMQMVFEFGQYFNSLKTPQLGFHTGIRLSYGINDITRPIKDNTPNYFRSNTLYAGIVLGIDIKARNYYN